LVRAAGSTDPSDWEAGGAMATESPWSGPATQTGAARTAGASRIALVRRPPSTPAQVLIIDPAGVCVRLLVVTPGGPDFWGPAWSPDGRAICHASRCRDCSRLVVTPVDGSPSYWLTAPGAADDDTPSWSPDGRWIVFHRALAEPSGPTGTVQGRILRLDGAVLLEGAHVAVGGIESTATYLHVEMDDLREAAARAAVGRTSCHPRTTTGHSQSSTQATRPPRKPRYHATTRAQRPPSHCYGGRRARRSATSAQGPCRPLAPDLPRWRKDNVSVG